MDQINPMLDFLVTAPEGNLETIVQSQMLMNETAPMNINLEHPDTGCRSLTGAAQKGYTESEEGSLDVNCNNLEGRTPLMLAVPDVDMSEKLGDLTPAEYRHVEIVQELLKHNEDLKLCDSNGRSVLQYAAQVKSTVGKHLTDVLLNHLSLQAEKAEDIFDSSLNTETRFLDCSLAYGEKNGINIDLGICGSQVSNEDSENTHCLMSRNTVLASEKSSTSVKQCGRTNTDFQSLKQGTVMLCLGF
ncbi:uncharacterized protein [Heptranchias perlo]|uniref:uncharacterized protein n=1 Tax=Heptranchias perlo TaxID=212740 RepID=UPI00355A5B98